jgi:excisionase family DNA binding protein
MSTVTVVEGGTMAGTRKTRYATVAEAAEVLECDPQTVRRYISNGFLQASKRGGKSFKINRQSLEKLSNMFDDAALHTAAK